MDRAAQEDVAHFRHAQTPEESLLEDLRLSTNFEFGVAMVVRKFRQMLNIVFTERLGKPKGSSAGLQPAELFFVVEHAGQDQSREELLHPVNLP